MYIKEESTYTKIIEKSRFIVYLNKCFSVDDYKEYLKVIKKKHYDASHVCSAFISNNQKRSSDDGEPSGTAGVPILSALEKNNIDNTCALVVRYFGGIKLGASGLTRAYGGCVSEAIKEANFIEDVAYKKYELKLSYELANKLTYIINKETLNPDFEYGEEVVIRYLSNDDSLIDKILEITSGIKPNYIGEEIIQKDV